MMEMYQIPSHDQTCTCGYGPMPGTRTGSSLGQDTQRYTRDIP